jgi:hypothetical protein
VLVTRRRSAVAGLGVPYPLVTVIEPLHSVIRATAAQPVQHATSWWVCR